MEKIRIYFRPIWYNIMHHKAYAVFCVFGTMLTFLFITILLQVAYVVLRNTAPAIAADRIVWVPFVLRDCKGEPVTGLNKADIRTLMSNVKEDVCCTSYHYESGDITVNGRYDEYCIYFIDRDYWNVFQFEFVQGHFFTEGEMQMPCVIVNENFVRNFFPDKSVINREIQVMGRTYKITGVVADVSYFASQGRASLWLPEKFNKNESNDWVETYILYPEYMDTEAIMGSITNAYQLFAKTYYNIEGSVSAKQISTEKQFIRGMYGGDLLISGIGVVIFILLVVPILNIILLSVANTSIQRREIGLKCALGASRKEAFLFILVENLLLVILGTILGVMLTIPVCQGIDWIVFSNSIEGQMMLLPGLNWTIVFISVLPLALLFSFLSGGVPAYLMVKRPIMDMLKGGTE